MSDDDDILSLHRYFVWANQMRAHFDALLALRAMPGMPRVEEMLYMSYWYAGLYVVIEGWRKLELSHPQIDELLESANVDLPKRYRNGVFHFQRTYWDNRFVGFIKDGENPVRWVRELNRRFGEFFLRWMQQVNSRT